MRLGRPSFVLTTRTSFLPSLALSPSSSSFLSSLQENWNGNYQRTETWNVICTSKEEKVTQQSLNTVRSQHAFFSGALSPFFFLSYRRVSWNGGVFYLPETWNRVSFHSESWNGVFYHQVTWNSVSCGLESSKSVFHLVTWNGVLCHQVTWNGVVCHQVTWNDISCHRGIWNGASYYHYTEK